MNLKQEFINMDLLNFTKEKFKKDIERFKITLAKNPNDIDTISNYGTALCALGRQNEGIEL